jgi:hypothetical protein
VTTEHVIQQGVENAFAFSHSQHDVSFPDLLEDAIVKVFGSWLEDHEEEIMTRIALNVSTAI